jgi:light-regulated signal transduction histidine kinase (bacteriophytochrome)
LWFKKKGLIIPILLSVLLLIFPLFRGRQIVDISNLDNILRALSLVIIGVVVSYLSEQRSKTESELKDALANLKRSNEDLQQFAYIASHDIKEPLRAIISFSELLEYEYSDILDENGKEYLEFITDGASRMKTLINDLLTYSRIKTNAKHPKLVDLNDILEDVKKNLSEAIKETNATIVYEDMPSIKVDRTQTLQLFQNLIINAIKFRGEEPPKIKVGVRKTENNWKFYVQDNGIGIEKEYFERIFGIFQRLHTREEYDGSGIGLAICKRIVERLGGKIWVESEGRGKGATFFFTIPINKRYK